MELQQTGDLNRPRLASRFASQLEKKFGRGYARIDRPLKFGKDRSVWLGKFDGQPVVFKSFQGPAASDTIKDARAELQYLEGNLEAPYFANKCIAATPDIGLIVLSLVPGQHVGRSLISGTAALRDKVLRLAGGWLGACSGLRSRNQELRPGRRVKLLRDNISDGMDIEDRKLIRAMFADFRLQAGPLQGMLARYAVAHSDFKHENFHYSEGEIHAVDIQKAQWLPIARKAARFLVMKDFFRDTENHGMINGLDGEEAELFLNAADQADEQPAVFRFFVGEQMVRTFLKNYTVLSLRTNLDRRALARNRMRAYLTV